MAFTTEQKAKIKAKANEIMAAEGLSPGAAAQKAVSQLFTPEEIQSAFTTVPAPPPLPAPPPARPTEILKVDRELEQLETQYGLRRKPQLMEEGKDAAEAQKIIREELQFYRSPLPLGFGGIEERKEGGLLPGIQALQNFPFVPKMREEPLLPSAPKGINYEELANTWSKTYGVDRKRADKEVQIFRTYILDKRFADAKARGLSDDDAARISLEESFAQLEDIGNRINDKSSYTKPPETASSDPWIRAFSKQVQPGEGVPSLTDEQTAYLNAIQESKVRDRIEERKAKGQSATKPVYVLQSGKILQVDEYDPQLQGRQLKEVRQEPKTDAELRDEILRDEIDIPWWMDPIRKQNVLLDPKKYEQGGILSTTTPYGTTKETTAGWLLRSAMSPFNAIAGAAAEAAYGMGPLEEAREESRGKKGFTPDLTGAVLLNVAEGRGFMGEAKEAAEMANVMSVGDIAGPALYYTTLAGGFAADILDPSIDIAKAAGVTGRAAARNITGLNKVYNNLSASQKASASLRQAAALGANDFLDNSLVTSFISRRFEGGDVRGLVTKNLAQDLETSATVASRGGDQASAVANSLTPEQRSSVWGKKFIEESKGGGTVDDVLARIDNTYRGDDLSIKGRSIGQEIDSFAQSAGRTPLSVIRRRNLARSLGSLASVDDTAKEVIRNIDLGEAGSNIGKAVRDLQTSAPDSYNRLKKILFYDEASRQSFEMIPDGSPLENIVALTRNTWAAKDKAKVILARAGSTPLGQLAQKLNKVELIVDTPPTVINPASPKAVAQAASPRVVPAFKLEAPQTILLNQVVDDLRKFNKIDRRTADSIKSLLRKEMITTKNLRSLIDANIDMIAEGVAATSRGGVTRARDLSDIPITNALDFLVPLEKRTIGREAFKLIKSKMFPEAPIKGNLSVGQRTLINKASVEISNLDAKLRKELERFVKDPEIQRLYGVQATPTYQDALARLVLGPQPKVDEVEKTLEGIINNMFYTKKTRENAFDLFTGTSTGTSTSVFTDAGYQILRPGIEDAAKQIMKDPDKFWSVTNDLIVKAQDIAKGRITSTEDLITARPEQVIDVLAETKGKIPPEVQVAAYYRSEGARIVDEVLTDLVNTEIGKGRLNINDELDPGIIAKIRQAEGGNALTVRENQMLDPQNQIRAVKNRVKRILKGEGDKIEAVDLQEAFGISNDLTTKPDYMEALSPYMEVAADIARGIIRRNGLRNTQPDLMRVDRLFSDLTNEGGKTFKQLEILFGEDVAADLRSKLIDAYESTRGELVDVMEKSYTSRGALKTAELGLEKFVEAFLDLRYLLILNTRPRFHGANLLTGAELAYSTTGRLINPLDLFEGATVLKNTNPTAVIFRDASGRPYTSGELNNLLDTTGRSIYTPGKPGTDAVTDLLKSKPGDYRDIFRRGWQKFKDLPQSEDLLFRYSILKAALKEGRSLDDALSLSRASMFDSGDLTKVEDVMRRMSLFYGFQRNSLVNALNNLASAKGIKRIVGVKRTRDNLSRFFTSEEDRQYAPSYAESRILLGKVGWDPDKGKDLLIAAPPLQTLDAVYSLADFIKGDISGLFGDALRPEYKVAFGVDDKFGKELEQVPMEHINILKLSTDHPEEAINLILAGFGVGSPVTTSTDKDGNLVIPLSTTEQRAAYKKFMDVISMIGLSTPLLDWSRALAPGGTKIEVMSGVQRDRPPVERFPISTREQRDIATSLGLGDDIRTLPPTGEITQPSALESVARRSTDIGSRVAFMTSAGSPITTFTPEKQAYYDRMARAAELRNIVKALGDINVQEIQTRETPESTAQREKLDEKVKKAEQRQQQQISQQTKTRRTKEDIDREITFYEGQVDKRQMSVKEFMKKKEELMKEARSLK